jgi:hypothetical protein
MTWQLSPTKHHDPQFWNFNSTLNMGGECLTGWELEIGGTILPSWRGIALLEGRSAFRTTPKSTRNAERRSTSLASTCSCLIPRVVLRQDRQLESEHVIIIDKLRMCIQKPSADDIRGQAPSYLPYAACNNVRITGFGHIGQNDAGL